MKLRGTPGPIIGRPPGKPPAKGGIPPPFGMGGGLFEASS